MVSIKVDFNVISEYCKAVERSMSNPVFTFITCKNGELSLKTEDTLANLVVGRSVILKTKRISGDGEFSIGVDSNSLNALVRKLYGDDITFSVDNNKFIVSKDNIRASFSTTPGKRSIDIPEFRISISENLTWFVERLAACATAIPETSRKSLSNKFFGILFDNDKFPRICKFSDHSLFLSVSSVQVGEKVRYVMADEIAKTIKSFKGDVEKILISDTHTGLYLKYGTYMTFLNPQDVYPVDYTSFLRVSDGQKIVEENDKEFVFDSNILSGVVDVVSSVIGQMDSWINFEVMGTSEGKLVWRVSSRNFKGDEVYEDVTCIGSNVIEKFSVNKDQLKSALSLFTGNTPRISGKVGLMDFDSSIGFFCPENRDVLFLLVKARV